MTARYAATLAAFRLDEQGVKAAKQAAIRDAMKPKKMPDPTYPVTEG